MPLRLYTNASGYGTQLRGGVLGRYGSQAAPRSPWAVFFGAGGVPNGQGGGGTYPPYNGAPPYQSVPYAEGAARATMGRAVGSIVGATQDGGRLIVRGVDGKWYITDNQGIPVQQTTAQAAQQLVTTGQFNRWAGTVMPDGNIQWANMSPADANGMALAMGTPEANGDATAPTKTGSTPATNAGGTPTTGTVPAGMKFIGIAADGKTLVFTDTAGVTHLYSRDPNTMQLTPIAGTPKPTGSTTGTPSGTTASTGTTPSTTTPPTAAPKPPAVTTLPATSTEPGVSAPPPTDLPPGVTQGTGGEQAIDIGAPTGAESSGAGTLTPPADAGQGAPAVPQTLMDVLNAAPDDFNLTPEQIAALTSTMVDSSMFAPPDLATPSGETIDPGVTDVPPPPITAGGSGGTNLQ